MDNPTPRPDPAVGRVKAFLCECGDSLCPSRVWLTPAAYGQTLLAVAPGHDRWRPSQPGRPCRPRNAGD